MYLDTSQSKHLINGFTYFLPKVSKVDLNYLEAIKFATSITNANSKLQNFGNTGKNAPSGDFKGDHVIPRGSNR